MTVYVTKVVDKFYEFGVESSYNNGIDRYQNITFEEVEPRETKVVTWHKVKTNSILRESIIPVPNQS
jgi:hypothetical protein